MWDNARARLYAVEPTFYDLSQGEFDADRICGQVRLGGGTAIRLGVHSHRGHAYYPSEVAPLAPGYQLGRDYVAEFIEAAERKGLRLAFSISVVCNPEVASARPDWRQIAANGRPHTWGDLEVLCLNTGYFEYLLDLVREFVAQYAPECLYIDNFVLLDGCRCAGCAEALFEDTGLDLEAIQPGSEDARRYAGWRLDRTERLAWQLAMAAKHLRGDVFIVFNGCSWSATRDRAIGWRPERAADWMDDTHSEFAPRWYGHDLDEAELIGAYHRALGKPGWCGVEYSPLPYTRLACPPTELRLKAGAVIASGCRPCVWPVVPMPPGDDSGLSHLGAFLSQFDDDDTLRIEGSFARTGIVHSRQAAETGRMEHEEVLRTWCHALTREHILWEFVLDRDLALGALSPYRLLIIPGTPYLSPEALGTIETFVRMGGAALFVGEATCFDRAGEPRADFAAANMLGVSLVSQGGVGRRPVEAGYLRVAPAPLNSLANKLVPTGGHTPVRLTGAEPLAHAIPGAEHHGVLARDEDMIAPAASWRMYGGGKVAYMASLLEPVLTGAHGPAFTSAEGLIGELVRWLGGERVRIRAPRNVTVQVHRAPRGATVHIVNRPPASRHLHEHVAHTGRVDIVIPQTLHTSSVRALDDTAVRWQQQGDRLTISVSNVAEYRCLRIEGALG